MLKLLFDQPASRLRISGTIGTVLKGSALRRAKSASSSGVGCNRGSLVRTTLQEACHAAQQS
jgi:hypothetical protein